MNRRIKNIFVIVIAAVTLGLAVATVVAPKKAYSENENRYLEDFPELTFDNVKDASFMKDTENYVSDHFILRDVFMTIKTVYERATGRNRINNIYMCRDGYYIEEYPALVNTDRIEAALKRLAEKCETADIRAVLVPTAVYINSDKLPKTAKNDDQKADIDRLTSDLSKCFETASENGKRSVAFTDVTEALLAAKDSGQLYYKLDHHWTTLGAYTAYKEIAKSFGFEPLGMGQFARKTVSTSFKGSFYSKVNDLSAKPDSIEIFESDRLRLTVDYPDKKLKTDTLYAEEYLSKKDQYSYFLNNQNPLVEIVNGNAGSDRVLAVVKDSYANCLVPFLAEHFSKIIVFDTRFYRESVTEYINANGVTDVLFLYNMYTIDTDTGISGIK